MLYEQQEQQAPRTFLLFRILSKITIKFNLETSFQDFSCIDNILFC